MHPNSGAKLHKKIEICKYFFHKGFNMLLFINKKESVPFQHTLNPIKEIDDINV